MSKTILSECRKFRYVLHRKTNCPLRWIKPMVFVMINPSTADESKPDKTVSKCISIAENNGCTDIYVVNLFPLRTKDVKEVNKYLETVPSSEYNPFNEENYRHIESVLSLMNATIVLAWGKYDKIKYTRIQASLFLKKYINKYEFNCLGFNADFSPKHPLFLSAKTPLIKFQLPISEEQGA
jgi:hypothetical protein